MENLIVAGLVLLAAAYAVYRLFFAPSCGCGKGDGKNCCSGASCCTQSTSTLKAGSCGSVCGPEFNEHCPCSQALLETPEQPRDGK